MFLLRSNSVLTLRSLKARVPGVNTYCKDYSSDDEKTKRQKKKKHKETQSSNTTAFDDKHVKAAGEKDVPGPTKVGEESAVSRLNRLLTSMPTEDTYSLTKRSTMESMARPGGTHKKRKDISKQEAESKDIFVAAKRVASMIGDGVQQRQTESELLAKLLGHDKTTTEGNAAGNTGEESEVAQRTNGDLNLSELIVGMKIDRTQNAKELTRGDFVRRTIAAKTQYKRTDQQQPRMTQRVGKREAESYTGSVNLFGCTPLGAFKNPAELRDLPDMLSTWRQLEMHALKLHVTRPPANYYEKLALWTEQGKVWRFPIDNEQDLTEEANVDFSEHIFLEQHLEAWCPTTGPIRHFMELVCVGLSKNPYLTANEKKQHILWYRDYFETKRDILKDFMSKGKPQQIKAGQKQLDA